MSVIDLEGLKVILPRSGADEFWQRIHDYYAEEDTRKWKYLAMLALRENAGWPLEHIGIVFGHPKGHVTRCLARIREELRARFAVEPEGPRPNEDDDSRRSEVGGQKSVEGN